MGRWGDGEGGRWGGGEMGGMGDFLGLVKENYGEVGKASCLRQKILLRKGWIRGGGCDRN